MQTAPHIPSWESFGLAIALMGLVFLLFPGGAAWLAVALVLGALWGVEQRAKDAGINGPLAELGLLSGGKAGA